MKPRSWLAISVIIVVMLCAGNLIGYWFFSRSKDTPVKVEATLDGSTAARSAALDRRDKALEALRLEDYDKAISNLEAAQSLDPTLTEIPKFIEVARKLKATRDEAKVEPVAPIEIEKPKALAEVKQEQHAEKREVQQARVVKPREKEKEREKPAVRAEPTTGVLLVTTTPSKLLVEIDGKPRDLSPARIEVVPGSHAVRILDGERTLYTKEIDFDAGEVFAVNETFAVAPAASAEKPKIAANESLEGDGKLDLVRLIDRDGATASREVARDASKREPTAIKEIETPKETVSNTALTPAPNNAPPRVLVFLPGKMKSGVESGLSAKMSGIDVRVVTRASELKEMTKSGPVDAMLASPSVLRQYGLRPQISGVSAKEARYVAASFRSGLTKDQVASGTIAAVDELGKKETAELITRLLGTSKKVKLRRVPKLEDLIPAMQVKLADAIFVRDTDLAEVKKKTQQPLHVIELSEKVEPLAVGFVDGGRRTVVERAVRGLDEQMRADLGVSGWAQ